MPRNDPPYAAVQLRLFLVVLPLVTGTAVAAAADRQAIGFFFRWGAFEEHRPRKCFAVAEALPSQRAAAGSASVAVTSWPERGIRSQLHVRLSRKKRPGSAVLLKIDGRSFQLVAAAAEAWAPDRTADRQIVAAMRRGINLNVESRDEQGRSIRDRYALRGAATAIDAALIACARKS